MRPAEFQQRENAVHVGAMVGSRILGQRADPGPGGQVDDRGIGRPRATDRPRPDVGRKNLFQGLAIGNVATVEAKAGQGRELLQPPLFELRIIGVVEIVDAGHQMPFVEQPPAERQPINPAQPVTRYRIAIRPPLRVPRSRHSPRLPRGGVASSTGSSCAADAAPSTA